MKRSLSLMNVSALAALCCGLLWGFAFDDIALGRDSAFYFFSGLLLANISGISACYAWKLAPKS